MRKRSSLLVLLLVVVAAIVPGCLNLLGFSSQGNPCDPGSPDFKPSSIRGTVTSQKTGRPIPGIKVNARFGSEQKDGTTNQKGEYLISDLSCEKYTVTANLERAKGYTEAQKQVQLVADVVEIVDFELEDVEGPTIQLTKSPASETPVGDEIEVEAKVTDNDAVDKALLFYRAETGTYPSVPMTLVPTLKDIYQGSIPQEALTAVETKYYYYVYAEDKSGNERYEPLDTANPFSTLLHDATPPEIIYDPPVIVAPLSTPVAISPMATDNVGVSEVHLFYRVKGSGRYRDVKMTKATGDIYNGVIPGEVVVEAGVEYYILARDGTNNTATYPEGAPEEQRWLISPDNLLSITITPNSAAVHLIAPISSRRM